MGNTKNKRTMVHPKKTSKPNLAVSRHNPTGLNSYRRAEKRAEELKQIRKEMEHEHAQLGIPFLKNAETCFWLEEIAYWLEGIYWNR